MEAAIFFLMAYSVIITVLFAIEFFENRRNFRANKEAEEWCNELIARIEDLHGVTKPMTEKKAIAFIDSTRFDPERVIRRQLSRREHRRERPLTDAELKKMFS